MMSAHDLTRIEKELADRLGNPADVLGTADFATRALSRMLGEYKELRRAVAVQHNAKSSVAA